jgi:hypothetical protein
MSSKMKSNVNPCWRQIALLLAALVVAQFFLFVSILESNYSQTAYSTAYSPNNSETALLEMTNTANIVSDNIRSSGQQTNAEKIPNQHKANDTPEGVAATVMLKAPKWFHRRYTAMIHNALANIPPTWSVQIFSNEHWVEKDVLPLHPGLQRLRSHPRIVWTPMPKELTKKKPKEVMKNKWLWESVIAENVLFFTGNGVFCANSQNTVEDFLENDYVGVPWSKFGGKGGDATSHSLRKRSDMIRILEKYPPEPEMNSVDSYFFAKHLIDEGTSKMANQTTTVLFGGLTDDLDTAPFVVSGTHANLDFARREALLHVCPELNIIFPSLHEPSCFGAHPNGEKCKQSICALRDPLPSSGC